MIKTNANPIQIIKAKMRRRELLRMEDIEMRYKCDDYEAALCLTAKKLADAGAIEPDYIDGMMAREHVLSTFIGNGIAVPHAEGSYEKKVKYTSMAITMYPKGIDWQGNTVYLVIALASSNGKHITLLQHIAETLGKPEQLHAAMQYGPSYLYEHLNRR
jgi:mannitol/fructose-specific phosphotransferase system IIA component